MVSFQKGGSTNSYSELWVGAWCTPLYFGKSNFSKFMIFCLARNDPWLRVSVGISDWKLEEPGRRWVCNPGPSKLSESGALLNSNSVFMSLKVIPAVLCLHKRIHFVLVSNNVKLSHTVLICCMYCLSHNTNSNKRRVHLTYLTSKWNIVNSCLMSGSSLWVTPVQCNHKKPTLPEPQFYNSPWQLTGDQKRSACFMALELEHRELSLNVICAFNIQYNYTQYYRLKLLSGNEPRIFSHSGAIGQEKRAFWCSEKSNIRT